MRFAMANKKVDITGQVFGRLTVIGRSENQGNDGSYLWICECSCGNKKEVFKGNLLSGSTVSCSCLAKENAAARGRARKKGPVKCSIESCDQTIEKGANGLCGMHYMRVKRYNDPNFVTPEEVRVQRQRDVQLANIDYVMPTTYRKLNGRHAHRVIAEQMLGRPLKSWEVVHHIDENRHNNDPSNLQVMHWYDHILHHAEKRKQEK
jgi:hypothetical protein